MGIIVQKFGGTSVRTIHARQRAVQWVEQAVDQGNQPVVVVSAIGRAGDPYATDTLLSLVTEFESQSRQETDLLVASGEVISAVVLAAMLRSAGLPAAAFTGGQAGIVTDENFGDARILEVNPEAVLQSLEQGIIPVVAGFQGVTRSGSVATLGRGGSDTTAVALGAALQADRVEIYTDVDGIKTADPQIVPEARTIAHMDYDQVFQLASLGARVIHPRAVELARQFRVALAIRSTFHDVPGTLVGNNGHGSNGWSRWRSEYSATSITQLNGLALFDVRPPAAERAGWLSDLFEELGQASVSVDLINLFPHQGYFCVREPLTASTESVLDRLQVRYQRFANRSKVSIIGTTLQGLPGMVGKMMAALAKAEVEVLQSADSYLTISLVVDSRSVKAAVTALHRHLGLDRA